MGRSFGCPLVTILGSHSVVLFAQKESRCQILQPIEQSRTRHELGSSTTTHNSTHLYHRPAGRYRHAGPSPTIWGPGAEYKVGP
jgi:hypothetical protein